MIRQSEKSCRYFRKTRVLQPLASGDFGASLEPAGRTPKAQAPEQVFCRCERMTQSKAPAQPRLTQANGRERRLENPHIAETSQELPPLRIPKQCRGPCVIARASAHAALHARRAGGRDERQPSPTTPTALHSPVVFHSGKQTHHPRAHARTPALQHNAVVFTAASGLATPAPTPLPYTSAYFSSPCAAEDQRALIRASATTSATSSIGLLRSEHNHSL